MSGRTTAGLKGLAVTQSNEKMVKHKRRFCRHEGCQRIVKSQGLCQRHGAKPRKCKISGCVKQAQGNYAGMCKAHFRSQENNGRHSVSDESAAVSGAQPAISVLDEIIPNSVTWTSRTGTPMPLLNHFKTGFESEKEAGWHRNEERQVRGLDPVPELSEDFEEWEEDLILQETLILSGTTQVAFKFLAFAWGRQEGFHSAFVRRMCGDTNSIKKVASAFRKGDAQEQVHPYVHAEHSHTHNNYCREIQASNNWNPKIFNNQVSSVSLVTDEDEAQRASYPYPEIYRSTMHRNERMAANYFPSLSAGKPMHQARHRVSASLTLDCEEWNGGSMQRFEEMNIEAQECPRCDSPLELDQKLFDDICKNESF